MTRTGLFGRRVAPALVTIAAAAALLVTGALPALAHNVLVSSSPADGSVLDTAPTAVTLTFDQPVQDFDPVLRVYGPNGNLFAPGGPTIDGAAVSAPFTAGPAGAYRVVYRVVSTDGHPVTGQLTFTLAAAAAGDATGTPPPAGAVGPGGPDPAPASGSGGPGGWLWVGIGVVALLAAGAIGLALRRPRSASR